MTGMKTNERPGTKAQLRTVRFSASKARVVLNLIRGKHVAEASQILAFSERGSSLDIAKVLQSAVANAVNNDGLAADELFVSACFADEGPTMKRFRPRARGRAGAIHKQTCHITIVVSRLEDDKLDQMQTKAAKSGTVSASADRKARVAKSRGEEVAADEVVEAEVVEAEVVEAEVVEAEVVEAEATSEAVSATVDSDADGEVNATDESPYGDGSHAATDDGEAPEGFTIKGNAQSKLYHTPESPFYGRTKAEVWFATEDAAEAAGFSKPASQVKKTDADNGEDA